MYEISQYRLWLEKATEDEDIVNELQAMSNNKDVIKECFYRDLEFGTGGLRGIIGAGTARLNIYTIRRTTQGLANYLKSEYDAPSVAIAYDSRIKSDLFAKEAAGVLAGNGIKVYIFKELMPTPILSYAVRSLNTDAGIVITASHNPSKYNGYKVYGADGCQLTLDAANAVMNHIEEVAMFESIKRTAFEEGLETGLINYIEDSLVEDFLEAVKAQSINPDIVKSSDLRVVYTPLNGAGKKPVLSILSKIGLRNIYVTPEQEHPDGNFTTVPYPNPELTASFEYSLKLAEQVNPDIILATDPDCDRVGVMVKHDGMYKALNGNEIGCLMLNYVLSRRTDKGTLPENPVFVKSIVSTSLADEIGKKYNCQKIDVLTGFKFIGEQITFMEEKGEAHRFVMGFEESYGYLVGTYCRDKDAVVGSMMLCEMAVYYKNQGKTLYGAMQELYDEFGCFENAVIDRAFEGAQGSAKMKELMHSLRANTPEEIAGLKVLGVSDYLKSKHKNLETGAIEDINLPPSDVLSFHLDRKARIMIRPSGTEPKIKLYFNVVGKDKTSAHRLTETLINAMETLLGL